MWCVCVDHLCQGDRVRVFGDRESGAVPPKKEYLLQHFVCPSQNNIMLNTKQLVLHLQYREWCST